MKEATRFRDLAVVCCSAVALSLSCALLHMPTSDLPDAVVESSAGKNEISRPFPSWHSQTEMDGLMKHIVDVINEEVAHGGATQKVRVVIDGSESSVPVDDELIIIVDP